MSALLQIKNKATDAVYTVTQAEWDAMEKEGRGSKLFTIEKTTAMRTVIQPAEKREPTLPPEVKRIKATEKATAALPVTHNEPETNA